MGGIYGLIVTVILNGKMIKPESGTGAVGAQSAMAASWKKMGFTGDAGGQATSSGDALFVGTVLIQVFAGNLGLYGLISALILSQMESGCDGDGANYYDNGNN